MMRNWICAVALLALAACGKGGGEEPARPPVAPSGSDSEQRPGIGEEAYADEVADTVPRFVGAGVDLRYDRCGVMLVAEGDTLTYADIDGSRAVSVTLGCDTTLSVDGADMAFEKVARLSATHLLFVLPGGEKAVCVTSRW